MTVLTYVQRKTTEEHFKKMESKFKVKLEKRSWIENVVHD